MGRLSQVPMDLATAVTMGDGNAVSLFELPAPRTVKDPSGNNVPLRRRA